MAFQRNGVPLHDDGASAVEYGLLISAIAAVIAGFVFFFGGTVRDTFSDSCQEVNDAAAAHSVVTASTCS
jgi:pilus assembly protein Flp/PilA